MPGKIKSGYSGVVTIGTRVPQLIDTNQTITKTDQSLILTNTGPLQDSSSGALAHREK